MAAKTQDAAGETVLPQAVLIAMLDNIEDELRDCTAGLEREPTLRDDLIAIADRLNHVVTSLDIEPATPRETALAAPRETATAHHRKCGLTPEMVEAHYPTRQQQFDECETCRAIHDIAKEALAAPQEPRGEPGEGMVTPLVETLYALGYPPIQHAHAREALRAALSTGGRDAD